ncbi:MAG: hypothetical protein ACWGSQ_04880 [Longimicrobiales bacterium]
MFDQRGRLSPRQVAPVLAVTALLPLTLPPGLQAQSLSYTAVSEVEFGGAMGMLMQMVPAAQATQQQTFHVKGNYLRMDSRERSTIMDVVDGRYTMLDHEARTFYSMTAEDMQAHLEGTREQMAAYWGTPLLGEGLPGEGSHEFRIATDRTGRTRNFGGYSAEQVLMTVEMIPDSPEAVEAAAMMGRTVFFTETWISDDFPGAAEYQEVQEKMGESILQSGEGAVAGLMSGVLAGNPNLMEAIEKNQAEMSGLKGVPVRTVLHLVSVPAGMEFDAEAVLAAADEPLAVDEMPSDPEAARESMERMLGGLLGRERGGRQDPQALAGPAVQAITMRSTTTIQEIRTDALPDDLFRPPPNYAERRPDWMRGG